MNVFTIDFITLFQTVQAVHAILKILVPSSITAMGSNDQKYIFINIVPGSAIVCYQDMAERHKILPFRILMV